MQAKLRNLAHRRRSKSRTRSRPTSVAGSDLSISLYEDAPAGPEPTRGAYPIKRASIHQAPAYYNTDNQAPFAGELAPEYRNPQNQSPFAGELPPEYRHSQNKSPHVGNSAPEHRYSQNQSPYAGDPGSGDRHPPNQSPYTGNAAPEYGHPQNHSSYTGESSPEYGHPHAMTTGTRSPQRSLQSSPVEDHIHRSSGSRGTIRKPVPTPPSGPNPQERRHNGLDQHEYQSNHVDAATVLARAQDHSEEYHVNQRVAPAVTRETIRPEIHHIREEQITQEIHTHDVYHRILPIVDVEVLPARHFLPVDGGGLVEVRAEDVPGRSKDWVIAETLTKKHAPGSEPARRRPFTAREFPGTQGDAKRYITPDGRELTEQTWVHPPEVETGAKATGQTWPLEIGFEGLSLENKDRRPSPPPESTKPRHRHKPSKDKATIRAVK